MGRDAKTSACRRVSGSCARLETRQTRSIRKAFCASTHSEDINSHAVFCRPINCGNRYDEAASGATPRLVNGHFNRAVEYMKARSAYRITDLGFTPGKHGFPGLIDVLNAFPSRRLAPSTGVGVGIGATILGWHRGRTITP